MTEQRPPQQEQSPVHYRITCSTISQFPERLLGEGQTLRIGKSGRCEIVLDGDIAPYHLLVLRRGADIVIRPLVASTNIHIGNQIFTDQEGTWDPGKSLQVGNHVLHLERVDTASSSSLGSSPSTSIDIVRAYTGVVIIEPDQEVVIPFNVTNHGSEPLAVEMHVSGLKEGIYRFESSPPTFPAQQSITVPARQTITVNLRLTLPRRVSIAAGTGFFQVWALVNQERISTAPQRIEYVLNRFAEAPKVSLRPPQRTVTAISRLSWLPPRFRDATGHFTAEIKNLSNGPDTVTVTLTTDPELRYSPSWSGPQTIGGGTSATFDFSMAALNKPVDDRQLLPFTVVVRSERAAPVRQEGALELVRPHVLLADGLRRLAPLLLGLCVLLLCIGLSMLVRSLAQRPEAVSLTAVPATPALSAVDQTVQASTQVTTTRQALLGQAAVEAAKTNEIMTTSRAELAQTEQSIWAAVQGTQTQVGQTAVAFAGVSGTATAGKLISDTVASQVAQLRSTDLAGSDQVAIVLATSRVQQATVTAQQATDVARETQLAQATSAPAAGAAQQQVPLPPTPTLPPKVRALQFATGLSGDFTAGSALPRVVVQLTDKQNVLPLSDVPVTLKLVCPQSCNGTSLMGDTTVLSQDGVAEFEGVSVHLAGNGYQIQASIPGGLSTTAGNFNIGPAPAAQLAFTSVLASANSRLGQLNLTITVEARDQFGNVDTSFATAGDSIDLQISPVLPSKPPTDTASIELIEPLKFEEGTLFAQITLGDVAPEGEEEARYYQFNIAATLPPKPSLVGLSQILKVTENQAGTPIPTYPALLPDDSGPPAAVPTFTSTPTPTSTPTSLPTTTPTPPAPPVAATPTTAPSPQPAPTPTRPPSQTPTPPPAATATSAPAPLVSPAANT